MTADSGPAHFAAMIDIPEVVFFGPETPHRYAPLSNKIEILYTNLSCSPCYTAQNHRHSLCDDNICMKRISSDAVFEKCRVFLREAHGSS